MNQSIRCIGALLSIPVVVAISGWVTMYLWNGIISPTFGLMSLSFWQAAGVDLFITWIVPSDGDSGQQSARIKMGWIVVRILLVLVIGWVIIQNI